MLVGSKPSFWVDNCTDQDGIFFEHLLPRFQWEDSSSGLTTVQPHFYFMHYMVPCDHFVEVASCPFELLALSK